MTHVYWFIFQPCLCSDLGMGLGLGVMLYLITFYDLDIIIFHLLNTHV